MSTATGPQSPPPVPGAGQQSPDGTPEETPDGTPDGTPEGAAPGAPARRGRGTWVDLVRSLIVVLGVVAVIVLLVPRPGQLPRPAVDVARAAAGVETQVGFTPILPTGLPGGWTPTSAGVRNGTGGVQSFSISYTTDAGIYAGVDQAASTTREWLDVSTDGGEPVGEVTVDGVTWQHLYQEERRYTSLLLQRPGQVVLITTKQGVDTATVLARALRLPAP